MSTESRALCQRFANQHKLIFEDKGEVGFGRPCVGFLRGPGYVNYNPLNDRTYDYIWPRDLRLSPPTDTTDAYHKHDCLAVLALGDEPDYETAIDQLAAWVTHLESQGEVEIAQYETGAHGLQAVISGVIGFAIRFKQPVQTYDR